MTYVGSRSRGLRRHHGTEKREQCGRRKQDVNPRLSHSGNFLVPYGFDVVCGHGGVL